LIQIKAAHESTGQDYREDGVAQCRGDRTRKLCHAPQHGRSDRTTLRPPQRDGRHSELIARPIRKPHGVPGSSTNGLPRLTAILGRALRKFPAAPQDRHSRFPVDLHQHLTLRTSKPCAVDMAGNQANVCVPATSANNDPALENRPAPTFLSRRL